MMMPKLLLADKDGTLVTTKSGKRFVQHPEDQEPLPFAIDAVKRYVNAGWTPVIVSNQGGVAAGHKTINDAIDEMVYCLQFFEEIETALFCPDFEGKQLIKVFLKSVETTDAHCNAVQRTYSYKELQFEDKISCRKPEPGMLLYAKQVIVPGSHECLMVGDRPEDEAAANAAEVEFMSAESWRCPF